MTEDDDRIPAVLSEGSGPHASDPYTGRPGPALRATLDRMLANATVVHVQPDDVLLIGNVTGGHEVTSEALDALTRMYPERRLLLFQDDIDVQSLTPATLDALRPPLRETAEVTPPCCHTPPAAG